MGGDTNKNNNSRNRNRNRTRSNSLPSRRSTSSDTSDSPRRRRSNSYTKGMAGAEGSSRTPRRLDSAISAASSAGADSTISSSDKSTGAIGSSRRPRRLDSAISAARTTGDDDAPLYSSPPRPAGAVGRPRNLPPLPNRPALPVVDQNPLPVVPPTHAGAFGPPRKLKPLERSPDHISDADNSSSVKGRDGDDSSDRGGASEAEVSERNWNTAKKKIKKKETQDKLDEYQTSQKNIRRKIKELEALEGSGVLGTSDKHKKIVKEIQELTFNAEGKLSEIENELKAENDKEGQDAIKALIKDEGIDKIAEEVEVLNTQRKIGKKKSLEKLHKRLGPEFKEKLEKDLERLQVILKAKKKKRNNEDDNEGYKQWLKEKGLPDDIPEGDVLATFGHNWFKLKDELAFKNKKDNESSAEYSIKLAAMDKILRYRKKEVDDILEYTKRIIADKYQIPIESIDAFAFGSITPTSDYDITFSIPGNPELETDCVELFNDTFKEKFGVSSGVLFDTNVYTNGFMTETRTKKKLKDHGFEFENVDDKKDYVDNFNPIKNKKTSDLFEADQKVIREGEKAKDQTQMALSYVAIRQALDDETWKRFKEVTINEVRSQVEGEEAKMSSSKDLAEIFTKTESFHEETENAVKAKKATLRLDIPGASEADLNMHAEGESKDALYVESLRKAGQKLMRMEAIRKELQENEKVLEGNPLAVEAGAKRTAKLKELKDNILAFEEEQGKALIYANEAYFSGGAAIHVVKGMQAGGGVELTPQQRMQSLLMNIGYKINHFNHQQEDGDLGKAHLNTAKYGQRIAHGLANGAGGDLTEKVTPNAQELLELDKSLITNVKKNDVQHSTPSKKVAESTKKMGTKNKGSIELGYMEIAAQAVANLYKGMQAPA